MPADGSDRAAGGLVLDGAEASARQDSAGREVWQRRLVGALAIVLAWTCVGLLGLGREVLSRLSGGAPLPPHVLRETVESISLVLMFQDIIRFLWGANPTSLDNVQLVYGKIIAGDFIVPVYNLLVIAAAIGAAALIGLFLQRTNYGRLLRATAENRTMAEALGVNVRGIYAAVFTLGTLLGTVGGALVVPTAAASLDISLEVVIEAFAVVVIGGLDWAGALAGALLVGLIRAGSLVFYPEFEILAIYLIVIGVLLLKPSGLFGKPAA